MRNYTSSGTRLNSAILASFLTIVCIMAMPEPANAQILCIAVQLIYSNFAAALATIAVIMLGIGALLGKVSWGMAIMVIVGISVLYGAGNIASQIATAGINALGANSGLNWVGCSYS